MVTWHSLATFTSNKLRRGSVPVPAADSTAFLHLWQVTAHLLGVKDEYIPATWAEANAQSRQVLDPILAPTTEGIELANILLNLAAEYDQGLIKPVLHAFTRYCLGDQIADWLEIPRAARWRPRMKHGWPAFVAFREGLVEVPAAAEGLLELRRVPAAGRAVLPRRRARGSTSRMPTGNNPNYSYAAVPSAQPHEVRCRISCVSAVSAVLCVGMTQDQPVDPHDARAEQGGVVRRTPRSRRSREQGFRRRPSPTCGKRPTS